ncbi:MAG: type IV pili methyl-accepting chemotaxis transducer N-terminal domain-containing protein [Pseudomonadota bacterium]
MREGPLPKYRLFARLGLAAVVATGAVIATPQASLAFETAATVRAKINLAGKQRMLSQRMAKNACLLHQNINPEESQAAVKRDFDAFARTIHALRVGDPELNLVTESNKPVLRYLELTRKEWTPYSVALRATFDDGSLSDADLQTVSERSNTVLKSMDTTVRRMARTYGAKAGIREDAKAINWAGAQRMLTQRMAKDICFIAAGVGAEVARFELTTNAALFEERLQILRNGDAAKKVPAPVNADVQRHLDDVHAGWSRISIRVKAVATSPAPDAATVAEIAAVLDELLRSSHAAVQAMEQVEG